MWVPSFKITVVRRICSVCLYLLLFIAIFLLIANCSRRAPGIASIDALPTSEETGAPPVEFVLEEVRRKLKLGEELVRLEQWEHARREFNAAIDLLLDVPDGIQDHGEVQALYTAAINEIHEIERLHVASVGQEEDESERVLTSVEELTAGAIATESDSVVQPDNLGTSPIDRPGYSIHIDYNERVQSLVEMYKGPKHDWYQDALDRGGPYLELYRRILREEGVPEELVYLSMVESAFKPRAVSRAEARGPWQFIKGTGQRYGLKQTFWVEDRFDPEKSARAAARHLKDLYVEFEDWYLAMAAYNSGARRVERAIRRTGSRDFWTLARKRRLPRETRSYVPLILAAIVIARDPVKYGFSSPNETPLEYDVVYLEDPVDLVTAAKSAGTTLDEMKRLNPELRRWVTPLGGDGYTLKIPAQSHDLFCDNLLAIPHEERVQFGSHVVRRGDTLSQIARRYSTNVSALTAANRLRRSSIIHPGQVLTVPVPKGAVGRIMMEQVRHKPRKIVNRGAYRIYVVRRGDTLSAIATSQGISLKELRELNSLSSRASRIYPGEDIIVGKIDSSVSLPVSSTDAGVYVVEPGDTLGKIAEANGMGLTELRQLNDMGRRHSRIYVGQKLLVQAPMQQFRSSLASDTPQKIIYRVRKGDNLSRIARRFGVSINELRQWNGLDRDLIVAGSSIIIFAQAGS